MEILRQEVLTVRALRASSDQGISAAAARREAILQAEIEGMKGNRSFAAESSSREPLLAFSGAAEPTSSLP